MTNRDILALSNKIQPFFMLKTDKVHKYILLGKS